MLKGLRRFSSAFLIVFFFLTIPAFSAVNKNTAAPVHTGIFRGQRVTYQIINGKMIFDGDIALDHIEQMVEEKNFHPGGTLDYLQYLWLKVGSTYQIPYMIDPASSDVDNINTAVSTYNSIFAGLIQWVPYTTQTDYIDFDMDAADNSGEGNSYIGRVGGKQMIWGAGNATVATLLHEMGHATGFWHEQMRPDRDNYVTINFQNMVNTTFSDSTIQYDDMQPLTLYDWSSIMEYGPWTFTKNGNPAIESIPPGMPLVNSVGYSAGDIDAVERLYGAAPTAVTVTTNPPGLQVVVDGATVTTPQTYTWPLFSTHTLNVPTNAQSQAGVIVGSNPPTNTTFYYTFGRWNDNEAQSHTITVLPGNGELAFPATNPAVTVYMASFIQLVSYQTSVYPTGAGTVTPTPAPTSYPGLTGGYYTVRQPLTLTATPASGWSYYQYINSPYWLTGGLSINPKTSLVTDSGNPINTTAYFVPSTSPIYTVGSNPQDSNYYVIVDGNYWPSPNSFSPYYEGTSWNSGTSHSIAVDSTQWPYTGNSRYVFESWSDGGAQTHNISLPGTSTTYAATLGPQYYLSDYANEACAGTVNVTPSSPTGDGFYPAGTPLTFSEAPNTGWLFTEWQGNLSGTQSSQNITMNDELGVYADYNTISTPLTLTSLSPSAAVSGGGNFTLALTGTGFTSGSIVFVNNTYRADKFVSPTEVTEAITTADLVTPGGFQLFIENYPSGASCAAYGALPFNVASAPLVTPAPQSLSFTPQLVSTTSTAKPITVKNTTASSVSVNSITATGDYSISSNTCGSSIAAGTSCTVNVKFTPSVSGSIPGALAISDSSPDSPQTVALTGTGELPFSFSPASLAFGSVAVGTTSAAKVVVVTNNEATTESFSLAPSGNYAISSTGTTCTGSLTSKAKCNIAVTFTPTAAAAVNGTVAVATGGAYSPQLIELSGTGTGGGTAPLTFTPASLTFSAQVAGSTSAAKSVTVKNTSSSSVTITTIGPVSGDFSAGGGNDSPCKPNLVLAAGATCTIAVTFSPASGSSGAISGGITVVDNATIGTQVFDVKGTSALTISFSPTSLTFTAQAVATTSASQTVTLTNNLTTSLNPTIVSSGDFAAAPGGATPCGSTLGAHAQCTITVTFTPSAIGTRASAITVTDSANPAVQTLNVAGTGQ